MSVKDALVLDVAQNIALIPLFWLAVLHMRHKPRDRAWWFLATGFAISWVADASAFLLPAAQRWVPSAVYPVSQSAIIGAVLLERTEAMMFLALLVPAGIVAAILSNAAGPDILLRSFAWLILAGVAWGRQELPHRLRVCLIVYFFLGYFAWLVRMEWLVVPTWYLYQAIRLAGLLLFCWAASENSPNLRLVR
jgi:hypothetical protein